MRSSLSARCQIFLRTNFICYVYKPTFFWSDNSQACICYTMNTPFKFPKYYGLTFLLFASMFSPVLVYPQAVYHFSEYTVQEGIPTSTITRLYKDSTGFLWLLSENGVTRFDGYNFNVY